MEQIIFINSDGRYSFISSTSILGDVLGLFLSDDVSSRAQKWIGWINNPQYSYTSSNASFIDKDDNVISVGFVFSEEDDGGPYFEATKEKFIKMLEDWDVLFKQQPKQIVLTVDDMGDITLEGKND